MFYTDYNSANVFLADEGYWDSGSEQLRAFLFSATIVFSLAICAVGLVIGLQASEVRESQAQAKPFVGNHRVTITASSLFWNRIELTSEKGDKLVVPSSNPFADELIARIRYGTPRALTLNVEGTYSQQAINRWPDMSTKYGDGGTYLNLKLAEGDLAYNVPVTKSGN